MFFFLFVCFCYFFRMLSIFNISKQTFINATPSTCRYRYMLSVSFPKLHSVMCHVCHPLLLFLDGRPDLASPRQRSDPCSEGGKFMAVLLYSCPLTKRTLLVIFSSRTQYKDISVNWQVVLYFTLKCVSNIPHFILSAQYTALLRWVIHHSKYLVLFFLLNFFLLTKWLDTTIR